MNRMRNNQSDWSTLPLVERQLQRIGQKALIRGLDSLTANERALYDSQHVRRTERARPVQHEGAEMQALATAIYHDLNPWWSPGFQRWEAKSASDGETLRDWREGAQPGWPDCGLFVPLPGPAAGVRAVVEMKRPDLKPRRELPLRFAWWLGEWPESVTGKPQKSWYGLSREQHRWLRMLHGCGFETLVAYGWEEAYWWLDDLAGSRPEVLPW